ncbi:histidinol dehydrogenase [uncultured Maricaulis sp.]|uniref:histidinol dehydrogenase n=1 Tax=uncultured Maricaulis sp. TaxID=174710 RepID=UPI0030DD5853|tara:strand:+ start:179055 stop:180956 length:1902 start_codon:yes stop_codon:yes gene_type:complete
MMLETLNWSGADAGARRTALQRPEATNTAAAAAREIVDAIYAGGDKAVRDYAARLDGYAPTDFRVDAASIAKARAALDEADAEAILAAADAVRRFHVRQGYGSYSVETWPGVTASRRATPVDVAALYVPAGSAPLVSTLIMLAIPAQLAGVPRVVVVAPPAGPEGVDPVLLAAASLLGLDEIYAIGGAQAVAALATGSAGLPRADKIFGPGNAYVAAAKAYVASLPGGPAVDLPAGPSEVMVIADANADANFVASDLLSQAEHDPSAQVMLVCFDSATRERILAVVEEQLAVLPRADIARQSMRHSRAILCASIDKAAEIANAYAPEHLILQLGEAEALVSRVRHAGSIFVGAWAPEAAGDYAAGPNHTLPTGGAARAHGGVTVEAFQKTTTILRASKAGAAAMAPTVERLAALEGLAGHEHAMRLRRVWAEAWPDDVSGPRLRTSAKRRKTKETDITVFLDLDRDGPSTIATGIGYFDHMLDQIARHAGIAVTIDATGDLEIDAHHTIEDVCLTLGEALHEALGDKRGIARFGFELPMDETRAGVWIDLSGRPFAKFEGQIPGERVGDFPVEMVPHAFRSLAESMKAAIHVRVEGENAHHMVEGAFKAFGRALRQAVRIESERLPSTKEFLE